MDSVLTKYKDVVVQRSCTDSPSSRGQWQGSGKPPTRPDLQHFCRAKVTSITVIPSSSNQEHLHHNYPVCIYK